LRFLLGYRSTAGFVRRVTIADVIERPLTHTARRVFGRRRTGIEWRVFLTFLCFISRGFPVADARTRRRHGGVASVACGLRLESIGQQVDCGSMSLHSAFQLDKIGLLESAAANHHVRLQTNQVVPRTPRIGESLEQHTMFNDHTNPPNQRARVRLRRLQFVDELS
jgi:hypothetical protein